MSDLIYTDLKISRDTADVVEDLLTLDSVGGDSGNGSALRFINGSATKDLALTLGRISASRVDGAVRLGLAVVRDPAFSTGDETSALLSLVSDTSGLRVTTAAESTLAVGGTLDVTGAATLRDLAVRGDTVLNGVQINSSLVVAGTVNGRKLDTDGAQLDLHLRRTDNPHATTAAQVGALAATGGSIAGNLKVAGATTLESLSVSGGATLSGSATIRGNLGIGTQSPHDKLEVSSGENTSVRITLMDDTKYSAIAFYENDRNIAGIQYMGTHYPREQRRNNLELGGNGDITFWPSSRVETVRFKNNGNVGIGTPAPINRLHVFNTGPGLTIDGDQFPGFRIALNGDTVAMAQVRTDESAALDFGTSGPSPLYFLTNSVRRMSIGPNGNIGLGLAGDVGIGTHLPKRKLHVLQEGADPIDVLYLEHAAGTASIMFAPNNTESWRLGQGIGVKGHNFELYDVASARTRLLIDANGNVGIGNQTPMAMLHVAGHMAVGPFASGMAGGGIEVTGPASELTFMRRSLAAWPATPAPGDRFSWYSPDGTARLWTDRTGDLMTIDVNGNLALRGTVRSVSSRHLKENIVPIADALAKVERLQGVSFTWKSDRDRAREIGFIAEDVGAVVPELVDPGSPGFLSYDRIAVLAVQAIKELSRQVAELSQKVMILESRI